MMEPQVIHGPTVEVPTGIVYEVTLPSGMIVTNPSGFGKPAKPGNAVIPYVTEDGRVLAVETNENGSH
jgi:hypothetical protein